MLPRGHRLTRGADLQAVRQKGKRFRTGLVEVRAVASPLCRSRVGIIVPRYKQTAVARNRVKRRLRELARLRLLPSLATGTPAYVVVRAWPAAYGASYEALALEMERMARQIAKAALPPLPAVAEPAPRRRGAGSARDGAGRPGEVPAGEGGATDAGSGTAADAAGEEER